MFYNDMYNRVYNDQYGRPVTPYGPSSTNVIKVHGKEGATAYSLPPNSSILLLDDGDQPIIWFKQTDGAGYPTVTGYSFTPLKLDPAPKDADYSVLRASVDELSNRLTKLEKELGVNAEPNSRAVK